MNTIEILGYILKETQLSTLNEGIISNTFVVEALHPYPGYHGENLPGHVDISEFVFLITKTNYSSEKILRATQNINKYLGKNIDAAKAIVNIYNKNYPSIRIKDCLNISEIKEIQLGFKSEGFKFAKPKKINQSGLIKIQKTFFLEEIEKGIYKDLDDSDYSYVEIPVQLGWEEFRAVTTRIKNSIEDIMFDAALGTLYRHKGVIDVVRIYNKDKNFETMAMLKEKFYNEIKRLRF